MNWDYFIADGQFKIRKLPRPKQTVKIEDLTDIDSDYRTELKSYGKDIEGAKKNYLDHYSDIFMVEVEVFQEYFDRNPKKFLQELNGLKGKYGFIEELYYWTDNTYNDIKRSIESWERLYCYNKDVCPNEKTLTKMEKLDIIERKSSSEETYLSEYIKSDATVSALNNIAIDNNINISGKKTDKINQLIESLQNGLIKYTTIDMYRPGKNFQTWFNQLQIKYIDEIEYALSTFDYPKFYIIEVWREAVLINDEFPLIETTISEQQQKFFKLIAKEEKKSLDIPKQSTENFKVDDINITVTTTINGSDDKIEKKVLSSGKKLDHNYMNEIQQKRTQKRTKEKEKSKERIALIIIAIAVIVFLLILIK